ncbi:hypothetical protein PENTCL1PPCAC_16913, partial [Pristionchus entomophagus]
MIYLSSKSQYLLQKAEHVIFAISMILNIISIFCLIKETPPHQVKVRKYLLMTQIAVIVTSVYMDILLEPVPLLPALAGICTALLCRAGIPPHTALVCNSVSYIKRRYSNSDSGQYCKRKTYSSPNRIYQSPYNLGWALERGPFFIHGRTPVIMFFLTIAIVVVNGALILFISIFFHMFYVLQRDKSRSRATISKIRRSLFTLFIQVQIDTMPTKNTHNIDSLHEYPHTLDSEANLSIFSLMILHPLVHNIILLGITPTYRAIIISFPRKCR